MKGALVTLTCAVLLASSLVAASPLPSHPEIIRLNRAVLNEPEYVQELARDLEKQGLEAYKKQNEEEMKKLRNEYDSNGVGNDKKYSNQRPTEAVQKLTEKIMKPTEHSDRALIKSTGTSNFDEIDSGGFRRFQKKRNVPEDSPRWKRNFDEIDGAVGNFGGFSRKRNFDPIDAVDFSGFRDSYYDKPNSLYKRNFDEIDRLDFNGLDKRNFDPIDRSSGFANFNRKRNFDPIDRSSGFANFNRKRNFDEIDHQSGFSAFNKRDFDPIDGSSGFNSFSKRSPKVYLQGKR